VLVTAFVCVCECLCYSNECHEQTNLTHTQRQCQWHWLNAYFSQHLFTQLSVN